MESLSIADWRARIDQAPWHSPWFTMDQARIDAFAAVTQDYQPIHVDPAVVGGTIAHGYLTLAMLSAMYFAAVPGIEGVTSTLNYGFERVRFLAPVRSDQRIRGCFALRAVEVKPGQLRSSFAVTVEIDGEAKPALAADWITLSLTPSE